MPIRPDLRWFYPVDWPQISHLVRFERAGGVCEECGSPHGRIVFYCLPDGAGSIPRAGLGAMAAGAGSRDRTARLHSECGKSAWSWPPPISITIRPTTAWTI